MPAPRRTCDPEPLPFGKRSRIVDKGAIREARRERCEYCGGTWGLQVHHIKSRGSGGDDVAENLICLCEVCHTRAHSGEISKEELRETRRGDNG